MRKSILICCLFVLTVFLGHSAFAQDSPKTPEPAKTSEVPAHFYHLDFVVQEMGADGKATNTRSYTATVSTDIRDRGTSIRTNSRIPVPSGAQFQYVDVGVNIDAHNVRELGRQLSLDLVADVSSVAATNDPNLHQPVIRQNKWQAGVLIPIGKATVVFTSDALDSKGSMQVVVTATSL